MCLIIANPHAKTLNKKRLQNAVDVNPDGAGILWLDTGEVVHSIDSFTAYDWVDQAEETKRPYVLHVRYATEGGVTKVNCHPFPIGETGSHLFHNGTVALRDHKKGHKSDSALLADLLATVPNTLWSRMLSISDSRFAIVDRNRKLTLCGDWITEKGIHFSKKDIKPYYSTNYSVTGYSDEELHENGIIDWEDSPNRKYSPSQGDWADSALAYLQDDERECDVPMEVGDYVAVYGTLKSLESNHGVLGKSKLIAKGQTIGEYLMEVRGIPYVYNAEEGDPDAGRIEVEVYEVKRYKDADGLDHLESNGDWYCREVVEVETVDGDTVRAWLYIIPEVPKHDFDSQTCFGTSTLAL